MHFQVPPRALRLRTILNRSDFLAGGCTDSPRRWHAHSHAEGAVEIVGLFEQREGRHVNFVCLWIVAGSCTFFYDPDASVPKKSSAR